MAIVFKTPKSTLNTTSKQIQNLGGDCPPCPEPVLEGKELNYTQNGEYTVTPEQGVDGFSSIDVTVNIPSDVNNQNKSVTITENGTSTVSADSGYSGLGDVTVDVNVQYTTGIANVTPTTAPQVIYPAEIYDGFSRINVNAVTNTIDANIQAENIKNGVSILGVTGNYSGSTINNQNKTVSPSTSQQSVSADQGYTGLGTVTVNAVTAAIDQNIQAENILSGVTILGVEGTDLGYDAGQAEGYQSGYDTGYSEGYDAGQAECPEPGGCENTVLVQETITTNGTYTYDPSDYQGSSYDAFDGVEITVNVPSGGTNCPDWSTIGWNCSDVTSSGLADDVAYTASVKNNATFKNDGNLIFAPSSVRGGASGETFSSCMSLRYVPSITLTDSNASYYRLFYNNYLLQKVESVDRTSTVSTSAEGMFSGASAIRSIGTIDMVGVTSAAGMFQSCYKLESLSPLDMSTVTTAQAMFGGCKVLPSVVLTNTSNVTNFSGAFATCSVLTSVTIPDTSSVTNMSGMFRDCKVLLTDTFMNSLSNWDTSNVTDMSQMFAWTTTTGMDSYPATIAPAFDTSNVENMSSMFTTAVNNTLHSWLETVPLYNCSKVSNVNDMFKGQGDLTTLGGFTNLGKAFVGTSSSNHTLDISRSTGLTKQSIMNVINNLAAPDDTTCTDATLKLSATSYALLDASDIAIATAKNWSVISA